MQITRQADYALRAVMFLSGLNGNQKASTSFIAEKQQIPPSFLAKIVSQLSIAGLIQTSRGARGGVSLAKPPEEISVLDVIEAIDGPVMLNQCAIDPASCPFGDTCPLQKIWQDTRDEMVQRLSSANFAREKMI